VVVPLVAAPWTHAKVWKNEGGTVGGAVGDTVGDTRATLSKLWKNAGATVGGGTPAT
jgi:hypothetical protein